MLKKNYILFYLLILSMIFIQCQCGDGPTEPPADTTAPTIISTSPPNNAINIPITDSVVVIFSEKIKAETITNASISVTNTTSNVVFTDSIAVIKFTSPLNYNTIYTVNILSSVTDIAGNKLVENINISFTTEVDPATLPPVVLSTYPASGVTINNITDSVVAYFSKAIDTTTLNDTTFKNSNGKIGTISYNALQRAAIFHPTTPFAYDSTYTFSFTINLKDTNGINLAALYSWSFNSPTIIPTASFVLPNDSSIIGDTATYTLLTSNPIGIDSVQYYVDNIRVGVDNTDLASEVSDFVVDASLFTIGTEHTLYAISYDSLGNFGHSDTMTFFYLWQEVYSEENDGFNQLQVPNDLRKMFVRSTDSTLELRYEYGFDWIYPYGPDSSVCTRTYVCGLDTFLVSCGDTAVDLGIYLDTDLNVGTGRRIGGGGTLNDIGAEYRIVLGLHGGNNALSRWNNTFTPFDTNTDSTAWDLIFDTLGLFNHNIPRNSKYMEIGLKWTDIGSPNLIDIVNVNVFFSNSCTQTFIPDFMPDQGSGHVRVFKENRYIGPLPVHNFKTSINRNSLSTDEQNHYENPFD